MNFSKRNSDRFQLFFQLREREEYAKAISILKELNQQNKNNSVIYGLLGTVYFETANYTKSRYYFKKATILNTKSELASLGLFHSLYHLGYELLALKELYRFIKYNKPVKYKKTISELKESIKKSSDLRRTKIIKEILTVKMEYINS